MTVAYSYARVAPRRTSYECLKIHAFWDYAKNMSHFMSQSGVIKIFKRLCDGLKHSLHFILIWHAK